MNGSENKRRKGKGWSLNTKNVGLIEFGKWDNAGKTRRVIYPTPKTNKVNRSALILFILVCFIESVTIDTKSSSPIFEIRTAVLLDSVLLK